MLVDTHCHLEAFAKRGDLPAVLERAAHSGVARLIAVGTSSDDWSLYQSLATENPHCLDFSVGLHPCHVTLGWQEEVSRIEAFWEGQKLPVALGEIGLDAFHLPKEEAERQTLIALQRDAFAAQLEIARRLACPIVIHSRAAVAEVVAMLDASGCDWRKVVFHCFTDGPEALLPILERGGRASFTGVITFKRAENVREALKSQGLERLMLETDAPYLAPEPHRGKTCEPAHVSLTAKAAAAILSLSPEEVAERTTANARAFFGIA